MEKKKNISKHVLNILLIVITLLFIWPIYWMLTGSIKTMRVALEIPPQWIPLSPTLENYKKLLIESPTMRWLFNSIIISVGTTVLVLLLSAMAAYALAKIQFRGSKFMFGCMIAAMTLPVTVLFIPLFKMVNAMHLSNSFAGVILPALGWPFGVFLLKQFMQTLPSSLIEAGRIDGCSELGIFARIILPLSKPGLGALAIFRFVNSWNDFVWQSIVLKKMQMYTLPLGVQTIQKLQEVEMNYGIAMAGATLATLPVLIVFLSFQKYFTKGITLGAVKG